MSVRLTLLLGVALIGCVTYDPFQVPREEVLPATRKIALASIRVAPLFGEPDRIRPLIAREAEALLSENGFGVVPSSLYRRQWVEYAEALGGLYDPRTGEVDEERWKLAKQYIDRELAEAHQVDAVLHLSVRVVDLTAQRTGSVTYCGTNDAVYWTRTLLLFDPVGPLVRTACLYANLYDLGGRNLYSIRSGIEIFQTYRKQTRLTRPAEERWEEARVKAAVHRVLEDLVGAAAP